MNIVCFKGGLGNQMFQYALYKTLEKNGHVRASLDSYGRKDNDGRVFNLTEAFNNVSFKVDEEKYAKKMYRLKHPNFIDRFIYGKRTLRHKYGRYIKYYYCEKEESLFDPDIFKFGNAILEGYWQSEKYFIRSRDQIKKDFSFNTSALSKSQLDFAERIKSINNSVAVHIRRGDYMNLPNLFVDVSSSNYYDNAIRKIKAKVDTPVFVFFSDDIEWTKNRFANISNAVFVDEKCYLSSDTEKKTLLWYDMYLMSCCKNFIIANSTYSWWGAWLSDFAKKTVVAPEKWITGKETPDIWCEGWIKCPII